MVKRAGLGRVALSAGVGRALRRVTSGDVLLTDGVDVVRYAGGVPIPRRRLEGRSIVGTTPETFREVKVAVRARGVVARGGGRPSPRIRLQHFNGWTLSAVSRRG
jgi:hypothetical protein